MPALDDNKIRLQFITHNDGKTVWVVTRPEHISDYRFDAIKIENGNVILTTEDGISMEIDDEIFSDHLANGNYADAMSNDVHHISELDMYGNMLDSYEIKNPTLVQVAGYGV